MFAKYFKPICIRPIYLLENKNDARICGTINGLSYAMIVSSIIGIICLRTFLQPSKAGSMITNQTLIKIVAVVIPILLTCLPLLAGIAMLNVWTGYNNERQTLKAQGLTDDQINNYLRAYSGTNESTPDTLISKLLPIYLLQNKSSNQSHTNK